MVECVYVGNYSEIAGVGVVDRFGAPVRLPEDELRRVVLDGVPLVPREEWDELGFTAEELRLYGHAGPRQFAPAEFQERYAEAVRLAQAFAARIAAGLPVIEEGD